MILIDDLLNNFFQDRGLMKPTKISENEWKIFNDHYIVSTDMLMWDPLKRAIGKNTKYVLPVERVWKIKCLQNVIIETDLIPKGDFIILYKTIKKDLHNRNNKYLDEFLKEYQREFGESFSTWSKIPNTKINSWILNSKRAIYWRELFSTLRKIRDELKSMGFNCVITTKKMAQTQNDKWVWTI